MSFDFEKQPLFNKFIPIKVVVYEEILAKYGNLANIKKTAKSVI